MADITEVTNTIPQLGKTTQGSAALEAAGSSKSNEISFGNDLKTFLTLFLAQLKNQNPLEPQDSSEFTKQIADLSSVEQAIATNEKLDQLIASQNVNDAAGLVSYVGKQVEVLGEQVTLVENGTTRFSYELSQPYDYAFYNVTDQAGNLVYVGDAERTSGHHSIVWNGKDTEGNIVDPGKYTVRVTVRNAAASDPVEVPTYVLGTVEGVLIDQGGSRLVVGDEEIPVEDVKFIGQEAKALTV